MRLRVAQKRAHISNPFGFTGCQSIVFALFGVAIFEVRSQCKKASRGIDADLPFKAGNVVIIGDSHQVARPASRFPGPPAIDDQIGTFILTHTFNSRAIRRRNLKQQSCIFWAIHLQTKLQRQLANRSRARGNRSLLQCQREREFGQIGLGLLRIGALPEVVKFDPRFRRSEGRKGQRNAATCALRLNRKHGNRVSLLDQFLQRHSEFGMHDALIGPSDSRTHRRTTLIGRQKQFAPFPRPTSCEDRAHNGDPMRRTDHLDALNAHAALLIVAIWTR